MNWLFWQQHRKQLVIFGVLVLAFAAIVIPAGMHFHDHYREVLVACSQSGGCTQTDIRDTIFSTQLEGLVTNFVKLSILGLPFLLGLFLGVPLIAKEYAENTNKLVWTQGISRQKWLTAKLGWILLATVILAGAFSALATWFSHTGNAINHDRFNFLAFSSQGIVPVATAVFAVALGVAFGAWFKKLLPALGLTLGILLAIQIAVPLLARPHYATPSVSTVALLGDTNHPDPFRNHSPADKGAWVVSEKMVNGGQTFNWSSPPAQCKVADPATTLGTPREAPADPKEEKRHSIIGRNNTFVDINCLDSLGYQWKVKYQPSYRYWNFQRIESALYIVLALVPLLATYWLVLKRDA